MGNISPVLTQVTASGQQLQALQGSSSGVFATLGGMNFFDMILSNFTNAEQGTDKNALKNILSDIAGKQTSLDLKQGGTAPTGENPLVLLQIALAAQQVDADGNIVLPSETTNTEQIQGQLDVTNKIINFLKNATPDSAEQTALFKNILSKLENRSETLQTSLSMLENGVITKDTPVEDIPLPLLSALGINPSEMTEVAEKIREMKAKLGRDITVEDLIAGVGGILPPPPESAVLAYTSTGAVHKAASAVPADLSDDSGEPTDDLAAKLNNISIGGSDGDTKGEDPIQSKFEGLPEADISKDASPKRPLTDNPKNIPQNFKDHLVNSFAPHVQGNNAITFTGGETGQHTDNGLFGVYGISGTPSLSFGTPAQAANTIATQASAGQPHPAAQMVAATISKAALSGEQTMTLHLDPPELGAVNVRLQFGKDKTVKTHLIVEKPETYMMLQRDGLALERALQSAGFDSGGNTLSFELAQDNSAFQQNNDGQNNGPAGNSANSAAEEIIETQVSWQVDPSTGHVRYNIFA
jgi:hypothetical protein